MTLNSKFVSLLCLLAVLASLNVSAEEEKSKKDYRKIDDDSFRQLILKSRSELSHEALEEITDQAISTKRNDDGIMSRVYDQVTPKSRTIFIYPDGSKEIPSIYLTTTRSTIISFFKQGMQPLTITDVILKSNNTSDITKARFYKKVIPDKPHMIEFSTNVSQGWTTVDLIVKGYDYPIPLRLVAGSTYDLSSKAVFMSGSENHSVNPKKVMKDKGKFNETKSFTSNQSIAEAMISFANSGIPPNKYTSTKYPLELFQVPSGELPRVTAYLSTVAGSKFILVRTNGRLIEPDYIYSQPSRTINESVYSYAIPYDKTLNFISIQYNENRYIYQLGQRGFSNVSQN